jgi:hypothetical protein
MIGALFFLPVSSSFSQDDVHAQNRSGLYFNVGLSQSSFDVSDINVVTSDPDAIINILKGEDTDRGWKASIGYEFSLGDEEQFMPMLGLQFDWYGLGEASFSIGGEDEGNTFPVDFEGEAGAQSLSLVLSLPAEVFRFSLMGGGLYWSGDETLVLDAGSPVKEVFSDDGFDLTWGVSATLYYDMIYLSLAWERLNFGNDSTGSNVRLDFTSLSLGLKL